MRAGCFEGVFNLSLANGKNQGDNVHAWVEWF